MNNQPTVARADQNLLTDIRRLLAKNKALIRRASKIASRLEVDYLALRLPKAMTQTESHIGS
jgi:hypothetical protein